MTNSTKENNMEIQTTGKDLSATIEKLCITPETVIKLIIDTPDRKSNPGEHQGKWAKVAEKLARENILSAEMGKSVRKASREFRDNFRFREPPHFEHFENDSE